jgi:adenylate cyclase
MEKPFPAYTGGNPYVFVCYAHKDDHLVYPQIQWLTGQGVNVWYDEGISPGEEWSDELGRAIDNADQFIIYVTPDSVSSRHCRNEVHFAQNHGKPILVVHLKQTTLPPGLELALGSSQAILSYELSEAEHRAKVMGALGVAADAEIMSPVPLSARPKIYKAVIALVTLLLTVGIYWLNKDKVSDDSRVEGPSIAVLPFANRSLAKENAEFLAEGIHDEVLTQLGGIRGLRVISRTSVLAYRGTNKNLQTIADELDVATVLEGSVQRAGDSVRITAKLINAYDESQLWTDTFDRTLTAANLFAIQHDISVAIADALKTNLSAADKARLTNVPTDDLTALEAYFKGKQSLEVRTSESLLNAKVYFEEAIARDPGFAHAYAGLAEAWLELPNYSADIDPQTVREGASYNAHQAVALDGELPEALAALGWQRLLHDFDWQGAEAMLNKALDIQPNSVNALHWLSHVLSWQGQHDGALALAEQAVAIDPLSTLIGRNLGYIQMDAGIFDEAIRTYRIVLEQDPYSSGLENAWTAQLRAGYIVDAISTLETWAAVRARSRTALDVLTRALLERDQTGREVIIDAQVIDDLELTLSDQAQIYAALGDREGTLKALEDSYQAATHSRSLLSMAINRSFDFVREDERYQALLKEIGLTR